MGSIPIWGSEIFKSEYIAGRSFTYTSILEVIKYALHALVAYVYSLRCKLSVFCFFTEY